MGKVNEIKGNLITLAKEGKFDAIVQGNNCFCTQGSGLAPQMVKEFGTDTFPKESETYKGDINKLGIIDYQYYPTNELGKDVLKSLGLGEKTLPLLLFDNINKYNKEDTLTGVAIINAYTQYGTVRNKGDVAVDYTALRLSMRKINHIFKGKHIGLPWIGAGLAGGNWYHIKRTIIEELKDCEVTLVEYDGSR